MCCIDNQELINNQNYPHSFNGKTLEERYQSLKQSERILLPSNQIKLGKENSQNDLNVRASLIPISSKDIIVEKKGSPFEDYEIIEQLGEGTFGKVFKVRNKNNNSIRAMKQISKSFINNLNDSEVGKEIEILKKLNHPYIIKLYEYYSTSKHLFLINEICDQGDLQKKIVKIRKFPEFIVKVIMLQVFEALMYLNEKSIIHGDLKLENILVNCYEDEDDCLYKDMLEDEDGFINAIKHDINVVLRDGKIRNSVTEYSSYKPFDNKMINDVNKKLKLRHEKEQGYISRKNLRNTVYQKGDNDSIKEMKQNKIKSIYASKKFNIFNYGIKLIDFGCSKIFTRYKKTFNDIIGTLVYCSPEVLANEYNAECDIWACGVLMYCLLSGHFPFDGQNEEEITSKILSGKFEFDIDLFNNITEEAKDLITKCLKYDVSKRITIPEALNHKFFQDLKNSNKFTEEEIKKLKSLKLYKKNSKFYQLVLTYLSYNFSDNKLLNELNKIFCKIDRNSDWKITRGELYNAYKDAGIYMSEEDIEKVIKSIDFDMNGIIDYEEFIRTCIPKDKLFTDENL